MELRSATAQATEIVGSGFVLESLFSRIRSQIATSQTTPNKSWLTYDLCPRLVKILIGIHLFLLCCNCRLKANILPQSRGASLQEPPRQTRAWSSKTTAESGFHKSTIYLLCSSGWNRRDLLPGRLQRSSKRNVSATGRSNATALPTRRARSTAHQHQGVHDRGAGRSLAKLPVRFHAPF